MSSMRLHRLLPHKKAAWQGTAFSARFKAAQIPFTAMFFQNVIISLVELFCVSFQAHVGNIIC